MGAGAAGMVVGSGSGSVVVVVGSGAEAAELNRLGSVVGSEAGVGVGIISPELQPAKSARAPTVTNLLTRDPRAGPEYFPAPAMPGQ